MHFLIGAVAGLAVAAATLGNVSAAAAAVILVTTMTYALLPVLAPNFVGLGIFTVVALAIGGGVALWATRKQDRNSRKVRAAVLTLTSLTPAY